MTGERGTVEDIDALLGSVRVRFWACPVEEHRGRDGQTVVWRGDAPFCTAPGCEHAEPEERKQERARLLEVVVLIYERRLASASLVVHKLGFTHREVWAMFDRLAELGILGPAHGTRARDFLVESEEAVEIVLAT